MVTETNWAGVTIKWDNRGEQAIRHNGHLDGQPKKGRLGTSIDPPSRRPSKRNRRSKATSLSSGVVLVQCNRGW